MFRKLFLCGLVLAAGAVVWNEYRLWTHRFERPPLQMLPAQLAASAEPLNTGEEQSEVTVIDLSWLQRQTNEPPVADTKEPGVLVWEQDFHGLPGKGSNCVSRASDSVVPTQFRPHSADGDDCCTAGGKFANLCKKITAFVWGVTVRDDRAECEPLYVMPRPLDEHAHHGPQQPVCPYLSGTAGAHYRHSGPLPAVRLHGEEAQTAPPAQPKPEDKRKLPKLDTMEIRPGDLPAAWPWRPF